MNTTDLKQLIAAGENEKVEFKKSFQKETFEAIVAFANVQGGTIIL